ncbi:C40 family peptidase [Cohnella yongneupensis]|uniref:C40 family peptidase n=1 Tax=Cohnella yongneupensis TaxID=425006 RepID=A0ABW0QZ42_9BACL
MRKQFMGLLAAGVLMSGLSVVPMSVSAASSGYNNASSNSNWFNWASYFNDNSNQSTNTPANDVPANHTGNNVTEKPSDNGKDDTNTTTPSDQGSVEIEKVIADGMKYVGTPYEFGSNRSTKTTFDCSDFVKWIFNETLDVKLPADSRQQGDYVKEHEPNTVQTDWHKLKRGDLMFFMSYEGSSASDYKNVNKKTERITHVGIYLGNGKILHTYSKDSGGVHTDSFAGTSWEHRFLYGGSVI